MEKVRTPLAHQPIDKSVVKKVSRAGAERLQSIPLAQADGQFIVAMRNPHDLLVRDELSAVLGGSIKPLPISFAEWEPLLASLYPHDEDVETLALALQREIDLHRERWGDQDEDQLEKNQDAPVIRLLQTLVTEAQRLAASDIHLEPSEKEFVIRLRIDGVLQTIRSVSMTIHSALVIRLKLMADLDITERRVPQDGRFTINTARSPLDVRVSTLPTANGESVVLRLLHWAHQPSDLASLGLSPEQHRRFESVLYGGSGMILVAGPTGSGKTTTLYSALQHRSLGERKIITAEDPVEYPIEGATQVQVNNRAGIDFSTILRATLRHDPDVVMIGEMRDEETAAIGLRAAVTGHLVLATVHTSSAISAIVRLLDMDVEPYMLADALRFVVSQRLVRKVCNDCAEPHMMSEERALLVKDILGRDLDTANLRQGKGCHSCAHTGYRGRRAVYEMVSVGDSAAEFLRQRDINGFKSAVSSAEFEPLAHGIAKVVESGESTVDELMKNFALG